MDDCIDLYRAVFLSKLVLPGSSMGKLFDLAVRTITDCQSMTIENAWLHQFMQSSFSLQIGVARFNPRKGFQSSCSEFSLILFRYSRKYGKDHLKTSPRNALPYRPRSYKRTIGIHLTTISNSCIYSSLI